MKCQDTDCEHEAIHIPKQVIELARQLAPVIEAVTVHGHGDGDIHLPIRKGKLTRIATSFERFLGHPLSFKENLPPLPQT